MPYSKPFKTQKKRYPRSKRKATLALKAYRLAKRASNVMEMHKRDHAGATVTSANDFTSQMITDISEGDQSNNRNGLKLWARSLRIAYECIWASATNNTDETVRIIIVRDKMMNGTRPTTAQILEEVSTYSTLSHRNNETEGKRFIFLYDKVHRNPNQVSTSTYSTGRKFVIPLKFPIYYLGNTSAEADQGKNNLFFFAIADQTSASTLGPAVRWTSRIYFDP